MNAAQRGNLKLHTLLSLGGQEKGLIAIAQKAVSKTFTNVTQRRVK